MIPYTGYTQEDCETTLRMHEDEQMKKDIDRAIEEIEAEDRRKRKKKRNKILIKLAPWQKLDDVKKDIEYTVNRYGEILRLRDIKVLVKTGESLEECSELESMYNVCLDDVIELMEYYDIVINFGDVSISQNKLLLNYLELKRLHIGKRTALEILKIDALRKLGGNDER